MGTIVGAVIGGVSVLLGALLAAFISGRRDEVRQRQRLHAWLNTIELELQALRPTPPTDDEILEVAENADRVEAGVEDKKLISVLDDEIPGNHIDVSAYEEFRREGFLAKLDPRLSIALIRAYHAFVRLNEAIDDRDRAFYTILAGHISTGAAENPISRPFPVGSLVGHIDKIKRARLWAIHCIDVALANLGLKR